MAPSQLTLLGLLTALGVMRGGAEDERLPGWGGERHTATDDSCHIHPHTELVRALGSVVQSTPAKP